MLAANGRLLGQINVTWAASTDAVGVAGYQIYRNGTLVDVTTGPGLSYTDTGLTASTTYSYTVAAYNVGGKASQQSTPSPPRPLPPIISNVSASFITPSGAIITWTTNEPANSQLVYGLTNTYGSGPIASSTLTARHAITLTGTAALE